MGREMAQEWFGEDDGCDKFVEKSMRYEAFVITENWRG